MFQPQRAVGAMPHNTPRFSDTTNSVVLLLQALPGPLIVSQKPLVFFLGRCGKRATKWFVGKYTFRYT